MKYSTQTSSLIINAILIALCVTDGAAMNGCTPPPLVSNGRYEPLEDVYDFNSKITYTCDKGYQLKGTPIRSCEGFRQINAYVWSGSDPECIAISCGQPNINDAIYDTPASTSYQSTVSYVCKDGLAPLGTQIARCTADKTWDYQRCETPEFSCSRQELPDIQNARHNGTRSTRHPSGTIVRYECNDQYDTQAPGRLVCQKTTWTGSLPKCLPKATPADKEINDTSSISSLKIELPIVAGVVTAVVLTSILIISLCCFRRRFVRKSSNTAESITSSPAASLSPTEICVTPNQSFKLPRNSPSFHHESQHSPGLHPASPAITSVKGVLPTDTYHQTIGCSPRIGLACDNSSGDTEFHTIRECVGDFRNNNHPVSHTHSYPKLSLHPGHVNPSAHVFNRTLGQQMQHSWTPQPFYHHTCRTTPYETVTCPHGVEHVYQPLEHVYEEPHIWTQPLPNPHQ